MSDKMQGIVGLAVASCFVCTVFRGVAEISADGTFAAKKPGESIVLATAANGDKELFAVDVT